MKWMGMAVVAVAVAATLAGCNDRKRDGNGSASGAESASTATSEAAPASGSTSAPPRDLQRDLVALTADDGVRRSTGAYYDTVDITVPEGGGRVNVTMTAFGFLPRVELLTQANQETLFQADGLNLSTSNLSSATINESVAGGRYVLVFTSVQPRTLGTYSVEMVEETQTPLM